MKKIITLICLCLTLAVAEGQWVSPIVTDMNSCYVADNIGNDSIAFVANSRFNIAINNQLVFPSPGIYQAGKTDQIFKVWKRNGTIYASLLLSPYFVWFDRTSQTFKPNFTNMNGFLNSIVPLDSENYAIVGCFTSINGNAFPYCAKWNVTNNEVTALPGCILTECAIAERDSNSIYFGMNPTNYMGETVAKRWIIADSAMDLTFEGGAPASTGCYGLAMFNNKIHMAFRTIAHGYWEVWRNNSPTSWTDIGTSSFNIGDLKVENENLYALGSPNHMNNVQVDYLAKYNGINWSRVGALGTGPYSSTYRMTSTSNGDLYVVSMYSFDVYVTNTGINDPKQFLFSQIYPNPTSSSFILSYSQLSILNSQFKIIDVLGRTVYIRNINNNEGSENIDVSGLSNGVYFYQLSNNKEILKGKFVKE